MERVKKHWVEAGMGELVERHVAMVEMVGIREQAVMVAAMAVYLTGEVEGKMARGLVTHEELGAARELEKGGSE